MNNFECPITMEPIFNPVILGQTLYEKDALEDWIHRNGIDPQTRNPVSLADIRSPSNMWNSDSKESNSLILNPLAGKTWLANQIKELTELIELKKLCDPSCFEPLCKVHFSAAIVNDNRLWKVEFDSPEPLDYFQMKNIRHELSHCVIMVNNIKYDCIVVYSSFGNLIYYLLIPLEGKKGSKQLETMRQFTISGCSSYASEFYNRKRLKKLQLEKLPEPFKILSGYISENFPVFKDLPTMSNELSTSDKKTFNNNQLQAFDSTNRRQIQLINGPPGSGKSTLISKYIEINKKQFDTLNEKHIQIFISEKNTAVDAIASKMPEDHEGIVSFGSYRMGISTNKFSIEYKVKTHPLFEGLMEEKYEEECLVITSDLCNLHGKLVKILSKNIWQLQSLRRNMDLKTVKFVYNCLKEACYNNSLEHFLSITPITPEILSEIKTIDSLYSDIIQKYDATKDKFSKKEEELIQFLELEILSQSNIIISTIGSMHHLSSILSSSFGKVYVTCILDEASATLTSSLCKLAYLMKGKERILSNIVIVGDPNQLPPYWPDHRLHTSKPSVYETTRVIACCKKYETILRIQYRMPLQINNLLNTLFYNNDSDQNQNKSLICGKLDKGANNCIFWHHSNREDMESNVNIDEIEDINSFVNSLKSTANYLIITPYRDQKNKMCSMYPELNERVYTIDQAQGLEADYILLSLVKPFSTMFMNSNRACVAFSRVKKELHVFGRYSRCKNKFIRELYKESKLIEQ